MKTRRSNVWRDYRWQLIAVLAGIVLQSAGAGRSPDDAEAIRSLLAKGSLSGLVFQTDDVDGLFEKVAASRAEVLQEPMDQPYGVRDCAFRDPAGNMVRFNQRPKS